MEIIETQIFTKKIKAILSDDEYRKLQWELVINPEAGPLIPGCRGLRKLRWAIPGKGKGVDCGSYIIGIHKMKKYICCYPTKSQSKGI